MYMAPTSQPIEPEFTSDKPAFPSHPLRTASEPTYFAPASPPVYYRTPTLSPVNLYPQPLERLRTPPQPLFFRPDSICFSPPRTRRRRDQYASSEHNYDADIDEDDDPRPQQITTPIHEDKPREDFDYEQDYQQDHKDQRDQQEEEHEDDQQAQQEAQQEEEEQHEYNQDHRLEKDHEDDFLRRSQVDFIHYPSITFSSCDRY